MNAVVEMIERGLIFPNKTSSGGPEASDIWTGWLLGPLSILAFFVCVALFWETWLWRRRIRRDAILADKLLGSRLSASHVSIATIPSRVVFSEIAIEGEREREREREGFTKLVEDEDDEDEDEDEEKTMTRMKKGRKFQFLQQKEFTLHLRFQGLGLRLRDGTSILQSVSGELRPGRMCAVMGVSGSGKTSFISALAGRASYGKTLGSLFINGSECKLSKFRKMVAFVPQEDTMFRELTVKENLTFSAFSRLPHTLTTEQKRAFVEEVLQSLGLSEIRYQLIGDERVRGVSGGQRKRVNVGIELVSDPLVLFLDEPTSGLDATSSMELVSTLRAIAELGLTVVAVIHQPRYEIFEMFHDLLLLAKGGRTVYMGETSQALPYFEHVLGSSIPPHVNPSDWFLDAITARGAELAGLYQTNHPDSFLPIDREASDGLGLSATSTSSTSSQLYSSSPTSSPQSSSSSSSASPTIAKDSTPLLFPTPNRVSTSSLTPGSVSVQIDSELITRIEEINQRDYSLREYGSLAKDFIPMFFLCLFFPLAIPYALRSKGGLLCRRFGGMIGCFTGMSAVFLFLFVFSFYFLEGGSLAIMAQILFNLGFLGLLSLMIYCIIRFRQRRDIRHCGHFFGAMILGPVALWYTWRRQDTSPKKRLV